MQPSHAVAGGDRSSVGQDRDGAKACVTLNAGQCDYGMSRPEMSCGE
jgi:hypothetical protein